MFLRISVRDLYGNLGWLLEAHALENRPAGTRMRTVLIQYFMWKTRILAAEISWPSS